MTSKYLRNLLFSFNKCKNNILKIFSEQRYSSDCHISLYLSVFHILCYFFWELLDISSWPVAHYVAQAGLSLLSSGSFSIYFTVSLGISWRIWSEHSQRHTNTVQSTVLTKFLFLFHTFVFQEKMHSYIILTDLFSHIQDRSKQMSQKIKLIVNYTTEMKGNLFSHMHRIYFYRWVCLIFLEIWNYDEVTVFCRNGHEWTMGLKPL